MRFSVPHILVAAAAVLAAACAFSAPAEALAAATCGEGMYAYAGVDSNAVTDGVSATIAQAGPLQVRNGHVAAWIGVVDPNSPSSWLQVGLSAMPNDAASGIYYEVAVPGHRPVYHRLRADPSARLSHRFTVVELIARPNWWMVRVDGKRSTVPIHLRGSHHRWTPQVLGESWAGAVSGVCNSYSYSFTGVSLLGSSGRLSAFADANYAVLRRSSSSFVATSVGNPMYG